jgi:hypothetical protein
LNNPLLAARPPKDYLQQLLLFDPATDSFVSFSCFQELLKASSKGLYRLHLTNQASNMGLERPGALLLP